MARRSFLFVPTVLILAIAMPAMQIARSDDAVVKTTEAKTDAEEAPSQQSKDEAAIRELGTKYVAAFNKHDAKALAAFWSPDAVYTDRISGERVSGREAIEKQFAGIFEAEKELKLGLTVESIQFVSPNVAVEHGVGTVITPNAIAEEVAYSAVYVRRDGKWLLDRVTDEEVVATQSSYQRLKDLEWMIGSWVDQDENSRIVTECKWTKNNSFITRSFTVEIGDEISMSGMQIVGWDASAEQVRSWTFDSEGGFSEGTWTRKGDRWFISKSGVSADGSKASAVNILTMKDKNTITFQAIQRTVAGDLLPNINEVVVVRQ